MLSVIIPSYKDPFLHKTIDSILQNATGDIEIIPVLDGYTPDIPLRKDKRIKPILLKENVGMREAINKGVEAATGDYLMRSDEHCMYARGFDSEILSCIEDNWIVTATRHFLDPYKWQVMDNRPVYYEKLIIIDFRYHKFGGLAWRQRDEERKAYEVDETMAMQGSFWIMPRKHWDNIIGRLDSKGYGTLYQDSIEMVMKTWQAGGKLMLNKNTWFAHKHRDFNRTHSYPKKLAQASFDYSLSLWEDYYRNEIAPKWLI